MTAVTPRFTKVYGQTAYTIEREQTDTAGAATTAAEHTSADQIYISDVPNASGVRTGSGQIEGAVDSKGPGQDMESIVHIDSVSFKNFGARIHNSTVNVNNPSPDRITIP